MSKVTRRALVCRREIWFPTIWGWLALLLIAVAAILLVARNLHSFLALSRPVGARMLVVEGWLDPEALDQAVAAFRSGGYERAATTGGPIGWPEAHGHATYAERAAAYLRERGLADSVVTAVPVPKSAQDRTYLSAVMVRRWMEQSGFAFDALDVFSSGAHARRSRLLYQMAFGPGVKVGVYAARSAEYDADAWWRTSSGSKDIVEQAIGLLWVKCCFWPPPRGTTEELWNRPPAGRSATQRLDVRRRAPGESTPRER